MKVNGAQMLVQLLKQQGIDIIFGIPGGANLPIYDALYHSDIRHILARHEQGAGFMAQGMARTTGRAAVCLATSGPGATNLITAMADAKSDSVPVVFITGQVPAPLIGTDAFQEVDTYGLTLPVTKHNFLVQDARALPDIISQAFFIARSGRPGPVAVDIPKDVQTQMVDFENRPAARSCQDPPECPDGTVNKMADMIAKARRPVFYIGGGIIASGAAGLVKKTARKNSIPVASTLMGLGAMAHDDPLFLGMLGMHGEAAANIVMEKADLIIAAGIRFDDRATGRIEAFCRNAAVIHVDVDPAEIHKLRTADLGVCGDVSHILGRLFARISPDHRKGWKTAVTRLKQDHAGGGAADQTPSHPASIIRRIGHAVPPDAIVATDVGQHQMWTAQAYPFKHPGTFLTSGGLGTMGFGLPAAIGAALANPDKKIVCISGDGSFLMNIQELATLAEQALNVTVILMDNGHLGLVRQQQELFYRNHVFESRFKRSPDFCAVARGFGIRTWDSGTGPDPHPPLEKALSHTGPGLIHVPVAPHLNVYPMVPPGASNLEMIERKTPCMTPSSN